MVERLDSRDSTKHSQRFIPEQSQWKANSASGNSLEFWQLRGDTSMGSLEPFEYPASNKISHNLSSEQTSNITLQELYGEQDSLINTLLKDELYGIRKATSEHSLDESELEYITKGTSITAVHVMFEGRYKMIFWFKDSQGRL